MREGVGLPWQVEEGRPEEVTHAREDSAFHYVAARPAAKGRPPAKTGKPEVQAVMGSRKRRFPPAGRQHEGRSNGRSGSRLAWGSDRCPVHGGAGG